MQVEQKEEEEEEEAEWDEEMEEEGESEETEGEEAQVCCGVCPNLIANYTRQADLSGVGCKMCVLPAAYPRGFSFVFNATQKRTQRAPPYRSIDVLRCVPRHPYYIP